MCRESGAGRWPGEMMDGREADSKANKSEHYLAVHVLHCCEVQDVEE